MSTPLLETRQLCISFGALAATRNVDFKLGAGARHALIGPNGAGKTTLINLLTGVLKPTDGQGLIKGNETTPAQHAHPDTLALTDNANHRIAELPYGRQRLVELAITLGLKPDVLLLDEPAAGVPSTESHIILDAVAALPREIGVLIIDHDMDLVFHFDELIRVVA